MPSRRRHHSGPPTPHDMRGIDTSPDGSYQRSYFHPTDYSPGPRGRRLASRQPPPPYASIYHNPPRYTHDRLEPVRGRSPRRPYPELSPEGYGRRPYPRGYDDPSLYTARPRRPYSHDRMRDGHSPPRRHDRTTSRRGHHEPRDKSRTPRSKSVQQKSRRASSPWWQNPILRTCAITAVSTGVSAALDSRNDPGQWKGAKGAKVGVAAVGSALVDGFLGQKHPNSVRQEIVRKGVDVAMTAAEEGKQREERAKHDNGRGRTEDGRGRDQHRQRHSRRQSSGRERHGRSH